MVNAGTEPIVTLRYRRRTFILISTLPELHEKVAFIVNDSRWPCEKTDAILQSLWELENTRDIGALLAELTV
jgi:hypothetical protein